MEIDIVSRIIRIIIFFYVDLYNVGVMVKIVVVLMYFDKRYKLMSSLSILVYRLCIMINFVLILFILVFISVIVVDFFVVMWLS